MRCPSCQFEQVVHPKLPLCVKCGARLPLPKSAARRCPTCNFPVEPASRSCAECGANLTGPTLPFGRAVERGGATLGRARRWTLRAPSAYWLVVGLVLLGSLGWVYWRRARRAPETRIELASRAASRRADTEAFQPPSRGRIPIARFQAFLEVRRRVLERGYQPRAKILRAFENSRHPGSKDVQEILAQIAAIQREMKGALAEVRMSREEYLWLLRTVSTVLTVESLGSSPAAPVALSSAQLKKTLETLGQDSQPPNARGEGGQRLRSELAYLLAGSPEDAGRVAATRQAASVLRANAALVHPYRDEFEAFEALDIDELILAAPGP